MILTIGPHRAREGSPAAVLLLRAEAAANARTVADDIDDDLVATMCALERTRLLALARESIGYVGPAIDEQLVNVARSFAVGIDAEAREGLVAAAMDFGTDEAVARRSIFAGIARGNRGPHDIEAELKHQAELAARPKPKVQVMAVSLEPSTAA